MITSTKPKFNKDRPFSWSALSSFEWNKEQWWNRYCLHGECKRDDTEKGETAFCTVFNGFNPQCPVIATSVEMTFGKVFAESVEDGKALAPVTILNHPEYKFEVEYEGIKLLGFVDSFDDKTCRELVEYKTGKTPWTQSKVDKHGQIDFYLAMNWIANGVKPEEVSVTLEWIPTQDWINGTIRFAPPITVKRFKTKRTSGDIGRFLHRIKETRKEMERYAKGHR